MNAPSPPRNPQLDLENLKAMWSYAPTQRERSRIEGLMWELAPKEVRRLGLAKWLNKLLDTPVQPVEARSKLRLQEGDAEALWARVDGPERMLVHTAGGVMSRAKMRAKAEAIPLVRAIERELAEYDTWLLRTTPAGTYRFRPPRPRGSVMGQIHAKTAKTTTDVNMARELWATARAAFKRIVDYELRDLADRHTKELLLGQSMVEIETAITMLQGRVNRARINASVNGAPIVAVVDDRKAVRDACATLGVDAPGRGEHVDHALYMAAKKNFKRLVREYHPDQGGDVDRYDAVVKAMRAVEENYQASDSATTTNGD